VGTLGCNEEDVKHTPNWSGDTAKGGGYGLYQLTKFSTNPYDDLRPPNAEELWNWKENVRSGIYWLGFRQFEAEDHIYNEENECYCYWFNEGESDAAANDSAIVPDHSNIYVTFSENTDKIIEDAVAMKKYNGLGEDFKNYCEWEELATRWIFYDSSVYYYNGNRYVNYYVRDVCEMLYE